MKRKYHLFIMIVLSAFSLVFILGAIGCKKVVQVDLNSATPRIVIEGEVINFPGTYRVRITKTVDFSASNSSPAVSGASVRITDSTNGHTYALQESAAGVYSTNAFTGAPKHTYILRVEAEGQVYTASSRMPVSVQLDSVGFARNTDFNNKKDINVIVNFQDPPGLGNYYQFIEYLNGRQIPDIFIFEDRLSDGRYIEQPLFNDSTYLHKGDSLLLRMYCVDKNIYNYFFSLTAVTANNTFQSSTPANPNTNISNGALGYFSAHTVSEELMIVY